MKMETQPFAPPNGTGRQLSGAEGELIAEGTLWWKWRNAMSLPGLGQTGRS